MTVALSGLQAAAERIWQDLSPETPGLSVEVLAQVDSTNSQLMSRIRAGDTHPTLLLAHCQSAGRGRLGRQWQTEPGQALTFSFARSMACTQCSGLSLAVGVALVEGLAEFAQSPGLLQPVGPLGLKWPNDLYLHGRKLGGILIETLAAGGQRYAVVGIGLNLHQPQVDDPRQPPAWLSEVGAMFGRKESCETAWPQLWQILCARLLQAMALFEQEGFAPFQQRFDRLDVLKGLWVGTSGANQSVQGWAKGVDAQGALCLETPAGAHAVNSAEVSVRPVPEGVI
jgi:BirA family biotin operon repressor/biotin-[acetyl-CoA-carboxylase] ligase